MNGKVQRRHQRSQATARRQQQALLVRAVFGSLVLCAALAPPHALAQSDPAQGTFQRDTATEVKALRPFNTGSFRDLIAMAKRMVEAGNLDLQQDSFDFTIEADRNADGSLHNVAITGTLGSNERWTSLIKDFVTAVSDSRALSVLQAAEHLTLTLKLDERAQATLRTVVTSDERAVQMAQDYNALLAVVRPSGRAGIEILNNMTVSANGKQLIMELEMSREQAGNLLRKQLSLP